MPTVDVHEAHLPELLDAAERGEDVYITRRGGTVTRFALVPAPRTPRSELFGALRGRIVYAEGYDTADAEIAALFDAPCSGCSEGTTGSVRWPGGASRRPRP